MTIDRAGVAKLTGVALSLPLSRRFIWDDVNKITID
jgi:hypothetical protein